MRVFLLLLITIYCIGLTARGAAYLPLHSVSSGTSLAVTASVYRSN